MTINYLKRKSEEFNKKWKPGRYVATYLLEFIEWIEKGDNGKE